MGYAMARAAAAQGAEVILVSGPVSLPAPPGVELRSVTTAQEMYETTHDTIADADIFIAAAAVADYRPADERTQKIKKTDETMRIDLVRCPDILQSVAALESAPFTVGFAAETENVDEYARGKLVKKKLDMIIANRVGADCGFDTDDNAANVFWRDGEQRFAKTQKSELANRLIALVAERYNAARGADKKDNVIAIH
jgi:phosphopantothenoylcysteine decarboxylase/phosphopantothenate--cysteine ligase